MTSFLLDESGDIYIDPQGKLVDIEDICEVKQRIINLFSTQKGSEIFLPEYGFDKVGAFRDNIVTQETAFNFFVVEALNPKNLFNISEIRNVITRLETNGNALKGIITMEVVAVGTTDRLNLQVNTD